MKKLLNNKLNSFLIDGYCIIDIFKKSNLEYFKKIITTKINKSVKSNALKIKELKDYHKRIDNSLHSNIIDSSKRYINLNKSYQKIILKNKFINYICKNYWGHEQKEITWVASLKKKQVRKNSTAFRLARPTSLSFNNKQKKDVGGVHFDLFFGSAENYNYKALITIWCPLVGFTNLYTLRISPKSHLKKHIKVNLDKQKKYLSPVFKTKYTTRFKYIRPNLKPGQAIVFHPNLLHGSSHNLGVNTRCSLDFRLTNPNVFKFHK